MGKNTLSIKIILDLAIRYGFLKKKDISIGRLLNPLTIFASLLLIKEKVYPFFTLSSSLIKSLTLLSSPSSWVMIQNTLFLPWGKSLHR
jgi:hypothetical protein